MPAIPTHALLPPKIAAQHQRLTQLLTTCNDLSLPDAAYVLREEFNKEQTKGFYAITEFVERLPTYIKKHMRPEYQKAFLGNSGLLSSLRHTVRLARARPENWPFWAVSDRPQLLQQRIYVRDCLEQEHERGNPTAISQYTTRLEHIERILAGLDELERNNGLALNASDVGLGPEQLHLDQAEESIALFPIPPTPSSLATLHPMVQQVSSSLFATRHYRQAIFDACIALDGAVQAKAQQPRTLTGKTLMTTVFSASQPLIQLSQDTNEQLGFMNLYQGSVQAIRNHYGHNLTEVADPNRAFEWLAFLSALFYLLDGAAPSSSVSTS